MIGKLNAGVTGSVVTAVNGWTAGIWDEKRQRIVLQYPGGHTNGAVNGIWTWDVLAARWVIMDIPSDPYDPPWSAAYRESYGQGYYPRKDLPPEIAALHIYSDIYPDGKPATRHQYASDVHDTTRDAYHSTRVSLWTFQPSSKKYSANTLKYSSGESFPGSFGGAAVYDRHNDQIVGLIKKDPTSYYDWREVDIASGVTREIPPLISENFSSRGGSMALVPGTSHVLIMSGSEDSKCERYAVYDLRTRKHLRSSTAVNGCLASGGDNELPALTYVPEWGKWLRRMTKLVSGEKCGWYIFDHEKNEQIKVEFNRTPSVHHSSVAS